MEYISVLLGNKDVVIKLIINMFTTLGLRDAFPEDYKDLGTNEHRKFVIACSRLMPEILNWDCNDLYDQ